MEQVSLTLLGGFQVRLGPEPQTVPTRKAQALLAYLALHAGHAHSREKLATLLWGNSGETQAPAAAQLHRTSPCSTRRFRMRTASWARRPGRKPYEHSRKSCS